MRPWWLRYKRGWFVWNPGSGGGGGTVQTDGVTIQGDGSSGNKIALKQVGTDATLTGAGTIASPLSVVSNAVTFFSSAGGTTAFTVPTNQTEAIGFVLPTPVTFSKISVFVSTPDNSNNSDFGVYNFAGNLVANIGAQHIAGTNAQTFSTLQGSQTLAAGLYLFAMTTAGSTIQIAVGLASFCWVSNGTAGVTTGGALAASITPLAKSPGAAQFTFALS